MKRRFPGDQNGPPGTRPHDPRFPARGGPGRAAPINHDMGRSTPPQGRFAGRGPYRPPFHHGRGPSPGPMIPRGPPPGRGPFPPQGMPGRGVPSMRGPMDMGRMNARGPSQFGRGNMPGAQGLPNGRPPMSVGSQRIPPPPPRMGHLHNVHGQMQPSHIPPPPLQPAYPVIHNAPLGPPPLAHLPPPPIAQHRQHFPAAPPHLNTFQSFQSATSHAVTPAQLTATAAPPATSYHSFSTIPVITTPAPSATAGGRPPVPTQQQIDDAWTEHTAPSGTKYYHNPLLNESTYTKPDALSRKEPPSHAAKRQWQQYEDPSTGKKYYSDGVTTTWEQPADFRLATESIIEEAADAPPKKKKKKPSLPETSYSTKEEAIAAFKGLLLAKGIAPSQKWNEVAKYCSSDARWEGFTELLSVGERRQALAEYQTKRANELKNQERQERIRAKEAFGQLLTEVLQTVSGFSAWGSRFSDVRVALAKDDRFHAVADEDTRESLFLDFCEELRKRDERKKRNKKRDAQEAFNSFLSEKEEAGKLTFASTWEMFFLSLSDDEKDDPRFKISPTLSESDRQLHFADFVIELQAAEDDKRRRIRDARRRAEKAQREAYRNVLKRLAIDGIIRPYTRWRSIEEFVMVDQAFNPVLAQDRDAPREIFEEFIDEWDDIYRQERAILSRLVNPSDKPEIVVTHETSLEEFTKLLLKEAEHSPEIYGDTRRIANREEPISSVRLYLEELVSRANHSNSRPGAQRRVPQDDSSEDEGEIIEEGEISFPDVDSSLGNTQADNCGDESNEKDQPESSEVPEVTLRLSPSQDDNVKESEITTVSEADTQSNTPGEHQEKTDE